MNQQCYLIHQYILFRNMTKLKCEISLQACTTSYLTLISVAMFRVVFHIIAENCKMKWLIVNSRVMSLMNALHMLPIVTVAIYSRRQEIAQQDGKPKTKRWWPHLLTI